MEARHNCSTIDQVDRAEIASSQRDQANFIAMDAVVERTSTEGRGETKSFGFQNLNATRSEGVEGREETEKFGFHNSAVTQRGADRNEDLSVKNFGAIKDGVKDVLLQGCQNTDSVNSNVSASGKDVQMQACQDTASIIAAMASNFRDSLLQAANNTAALQASIAKGVCDIELDAAKNAAAVALQVTLTAKDAEISAVTNAKDALINANLNASMLSRQASDNAKDAALTAALNAAAVAKQISDCCCETKELLLSDGNKTRDLIRSENEQRLREELAHLRLQLVRSTLPPLPVAAVS